MKAKVQILSHIKHIYLQTRCEEQLTQLTLESFVQTCTRSLLPRLQQMFKTSPLRLYTSSQTLSPLADSRVDNVLIHISPDFTQSLFQFIDVVDSVLIHPLLHNSPDGVVNGV